ncbi:MAG: hypothetical protein QXI89_02130 [Candidatus Anstonellales archaeon]
MEEIIRQIIHIYAGIIIAAIALVLGLQITSYILFLLLLLILIYINSVLVYGGPGRLNNITRKEENSIFPAKGAVFYFASLLFLSSFQHINLSTFIAACLALAIGDGFSTLGGRAFNTKGKSFIGSFLGFIPLLFSYILIGFPLIFSFLTAFFAMLMERYAVIDDNIWVPFSVAAWVSLLYTFGI